MKLLDPDAYLWMMAAALAVLTIVLGLLCRNKRRTRLRRFTPLVLLLAWGSFNYGAFVEPNHLKVKRVEVAFTDLPAAFDGYKIVLFSDIHLGTMAGRGEALLQRAVDSINAEKADLVAFTGDLQNRKPEEILPFVPLLSSIKATNGVCSVMGNHDYTMYLGTDDPFLISSNLGMTMGLHEEMGWTLLNNTRLVIRRDSARIVISGMENDGEGRFPELGNVNEALWGISRNDFVVMLEHDPTSWRRKILPHSHTQLTLSGHTHGGQVALLGCSPASLLYHEHQGLYEIGGRRLYVTTGLSGVVPFRLGVCPEIVVITLRASKSKPK